MNTTTTTTNTPVTSITVAMPVLQGTDPGDWNWANAALSAWLTEADGAAIDVTKEVYLAGLEGWDDTDCVGVVLSRFGTCHVVYVADGNVVCGRALQEG